MEHRKYKRIQVHSDINGKMIITSHIEILDLSLSGIKFFCLKRVNTNSLNKIRLTKDDISVEVRGRVVRSTLKNSIVNGQAMPVYEVAMSFEDLTDDCKESLKLLIKKLDYE